MSEKKHKFCSFEEAKRYARSLHLSGRYDWVVLASTPKGLKSSVPKNPDEIYKKEWKSWKDFLGYKKRVPFLPFEEARSFVRALNLSGLKEWKSYINWDPNDVGLKPAFIPSSPHIQYKDEGWKGYSDFIGTLNKSFSSKTFRSFESARKYARALGLTSSAQWIEYCKGNIKGLLPKPNDIPSNIARQYAKDGFSGMDDFLNTKYHREVKRRKEHRTFEEARRFVHSLKLNNLIEWNLFIKGELPHRKQLPTDIPSNPKLVYKDSGWAGFGDWLGTYKVPPFQMEFRDFNSARDFARKLGLNSSTEWIAYCRGEYPNLPEKPEDIPHSVARHYQDSGWIDYKDFLMDDEKRATYSKFLPYQEAKEFVNSLKLQNVIEWQRYLKGELTHLPPKPANIPSNPTNIYKDNGWVGMGDWLDNGTFPYASMDYRSFKEVRIFVRSLGLVTSQEWVAYCKGTIPNLPEKPIDIPANVVKQYTKKGWRGFKDFLNTKHNREQLKNARDFDESKKWAKELGMESVSEWPDFCSGKLKDKYGIKPFDIPSQPDVVYLRFGWTNFEDWLGIK